jgi:hypothetical protein
MNENAKDGTHRMHGLCTLKYEEWKLIFNINGSI